MPTVCDPCPGNSHATLPMERWSLAADLLRELREVALDFGERELPQDRRVRLARAEEIEGAARQVGDVTAAVPLMFGARDAHAMDGRGRVVHRHGRDPSIAFVLQKDANGYEGHRA